MGNYSAEEEKLGFVTRKLCSSGEKPSFKVSGHDN